MSQVDDAAQDLGICLETTVLGAFWTALCALLLAGIGCAPSNAQGDAGGSQAVPCVTALRLYDGDGALMGDLVSFPAMPRMEYPHAPWVIEYLPPAASSPIELTYQGCIGTTGLDFVAFESTDCSGAEGVALPGSYGSEKPGEIFRDTTVSMLSVDSNGTPKTIQARSFLVRSADQCTGVCATLDSHTLGGTQVPGLPGFADATPESGLSVTGVLVHDTGSRIGEFVQFPAEQEAVVRVELGVCSSP